MKSQSYADGTATVDGVAFAYTELGNYGNGIQMRNKSKTSSFNNTDAFAKGITKIEFNYNASQANFSNADALKIEFANSVDFQTLKPRCLAL